MATSTWRNVASHHVIVGPSGAAFGAGDPEYARLLAVDAALMANSGVDGWPAGGGGGGFVDFGEGMATGVARRGVRTDRMASWAEDSQMQVGLVTQFSLGES